MEKTKKEMKNKINWSLWLSVVAIILSIFSFFISEGTLQFDKVNFIIGVLAVLVTFLLGWQIYNIVNWDKKIKEEISNGVEIKTIDIERKIDKIFGIIERMNTNVYQNAIYQNTYLFLEILNIQKDKKKIELYLSKIEDLTKEYDEPFSGGLKSKLIYQIRLKQAEELLQKANKLSEGIRNSKEIETLIKELEKIINRGEFAVV